MLMNTCSNQRVPSQLSHYATSCLYSPLEYQFFIETSQEPRLLDDLKRQALRNRRHMEYSDGTSMFGEPAR